MVNTFGYTTGVESASDTTGYTFDVADGMAGPHYARCTIALASGDGGTLVMGDCPGIQRAALSHVDVSQVKESDVYFVTAITSRVLWSVKDDKG